MRARLRIKIYPGHVQFFRVKLLTSNSEQIAKTIDQMEKDVKSIKQESLKMCWYMRGGLTYNEAMNLGADERKMISELIKENMETTKKSGLPFF